MLLKKSSPSRESEPPISKSWLTEYGDLLALLMVFFVLLYTIVWATEKNNYENSEALITDSYEALRHFCENELSPEDYTLERVTQGVLVHLPIERWFETEKPIIKPAMQVHLKNLSRKISELKLLSIDRKGEPDIRFTSDSATDEMMRIQLNITQLQQQAGTALNRHTDDLFLARAKQLAIALNESLWVRDYWFEINPEQVDVPPALKSDESQRDKQPRRNLTMVISASFEAN